MLQGRRQRPAGGPPPLENRVWYGYVGVFAYISAEFAPVSCTQRALCTVASNYWSGGGSCSCTATQCLRHMAQIPYCDVVFTAVCTTYRVFWSLEGKNLAKWTLEISLNVDKFAEDLRKMRLKWWLVKIFKIDFWAPPLENFLPAGLANYTKENKLCCLRHLICEAIR